MNILLVGYETESCSLSLVGKRLEDDGHDVLLVLGDYHNFINNESIRRFIRRHGVDNWVNFSDEYQSMYRSRWDVDWDYLEEFERTYCANKNFQQLLLTDPLLSRHHHHRRPYYTPIESPELVHWWAEQLLRWIVDVVDEFDPDAIFTYKRNYFVKNALAQMAFSLEIPMLTLIHSRINDYCHLTRHFGYGADPDARPYLEADSTEIDTTQAEAYASEYTDSSESASLYDATSQQLIRDGRLFTTTGVIRNLAGQFTNHLKRRVLYRKKRKYRGWFRGNHFDSHTPHVLENEVRKARNRLRYIHANPFSRSVPDRPFVYFPLHMLPESATLTLSTEYFETDLVRYVSKELPVGMQLAVKENPNMVGSRPFDVYSELSDLPNVRLMDPVVPSKSLITRSEGVCSISGTALLEAAILGKPTHAFGLPEFLDVVDFAGHDEFSQFVRACRSDGFETNPELSVRYVQYVFDEGREVSLYKLRNKQTSPEFSDGIDVVYDMLSAEIERGLVPVGDDARWAST